MTRKEAENILSRIEYISGEVIKGDYRRVWLSVLPCQNYNRFVHWLTEAGNILKRTGQFDFNYRRLIKWVDYKQWEYEHGQVWYKQTVSAYTEIIKAVMNKKITVKQLEDELFPEIEEQGWTQELFSMGASHKKRYELWKERALCFGFNQH